MKSPKILRYKRSPDLCRRKKIGQSTLHLHVLLPPPMEQADSPPQIGVSLVGRNVNKVLHKVKKILWPLADRIFQIKLSPTSRPLKNIVFCSKPHFLQVIMPQLIQYAKIPLNAIFHPMTSAKDLLPQNPNFRVHFQMTRTVMVQQIVKGAEQSCFRFFFIILLLCRLIHFLRSCFVMKNWQLNCCSYLYRQNLCVLFCLKVMLN